MADKAKPEKNYLERWPGLYIRKGNEILDAPEEDQKVARGYPQWPDKGPILDGKRITVMVKKKSYRVNEEIRILHVAEVTVPGREVFIMGPKLILGEQVDGKLVTEPHPEGCEPLNPPDCYNGRVLQSPALDYNYDITFYKFDRPGKHELQWVLGPLRSNILEVEVVK